LGGASETPNRGVGLEFIGPFQLRVGNQKGNDKAHKKRLCRKSVNFRKRKDRKGKRNHLWGPIAARGAVPPRNGGAKNI